MALYCSLTHPRNPLATLLRLIISTHHIGTRVLCHCAVRCRNGASCMPACHPMHPLTGSRPAVWRPHWVCCCCTRPSNGTGSTPSRRPTCPLPISTRCFMPCRP
ncbi:hypothetical protein DENSPDRAFT_845944 [Dentipellis sp. KUC8613]|nr:hypothetical protein DENSPDRAFT_845944 [Dentipellis sp. KUC8613]